MKLGLKQDEVRLVDYWPGWKEAFDQQKEALQAATGLEAHYIEHIGSAAIEGMASKPIIDILVGVEALEDVDESLLAGLKEAGFLRLKVERPGEIVLAKFTDHSFQEKTHFIHLVDYQGELWKNLLFFRDYLRAHEEARKQYEDLKFAYVKTASHGINDYTDSKEAFVKMIMRKRSE